MSESSLASNLINYSLNTESGIYKQVLTHIIVCQCAAAVSDFDRVVSSVENIRALSAADEECRKMLGEIDIIISDKEWTLSEYKQKNLLSKINRYFEYCYENVSLGLTDEKFASLYLEFIKSRLEMEFGFSYLAIARYYMASGNYELVFNIIESVINKFPDSKYEYLALCDLMEIYKMEYQSLERNNEEFGQIIEKIVQILLYILKSYSYQPRSFYTIIKFAYIVFRYERGVTSLSFYEKLTEVYGEGIYEEEIKLEFVNYYIGRAKYKDAITYLNEYENIFTKTTRKNIINLYKFECYICLKDSINAHNIYKAIDEKSYNENNDALIKLYHLVAKFASLLEDANCLKDAISVYEKIYKNVPLKKLKEEALYKLVTLNINLYFNNKEKMPEEIKNIARGYCVSFMSKYGKSSHMDEIKLIYDGLNINNSALKPEPVQQSQAAVKTDSENAARDKKPLAPVQPQESLKESADKRPRPAESVKKAPLIEVRTGGAIKVTTGAIGNGIKDASSPAPVSQPPDVKTPRVKQESVRPEKKEPESRRQLIEAAQTHLPVVKTSEKADVALNIAGAPAVDSSIEKKAFKPEGFDYIKFLLYSSIAAVYMYVFFMVPSFSVAVFYSKMLLSYFPILALTGALLFSLFKKMKIFE